jgi:hypothetical protein
MRYYDFIEKYLKTNEFSPIVRGEFLPGNNGLYGEVETIYRNMSHWLVLFCDAGDSIKQSSIVPLAKEAFDTYTQGRTTGGTYQARFSEKDASNGLIGSAWVLEGIEALSRLPGIGVNDLDYLQTIATEISQLYIWDENKNYILNVVEPDGRQVTTDRTFNHQLWLVASIYVSALWSENLSLMDKCKGFINNLDSLMKTNNRGLVYHTLGVYPHYHRTFLKRILSAAYRNEMIHKEYGYHAFNLLGYVRILRLCRPDTLCEKTRALVEVCNNDEFWGRQRDNKFGSTYNPVGLEVAAAASIFKDDKLVLRALNYHFQNFFDTSIYKFTGGSDEPTLNARLYEMTYLRPDIKGRLDFDEERRQWRLIE